MTVVETPANSGTEEKKWVVEYQPTDEAGNPIGRPTKLEADTQQELIEKMKETNIQIVRAYHKLKTTGGAKPDLKDAEQRKAPARQVKREWTPDEEFQTATELLQPATSRRAVRKIVEAELGMPIEELHEIREGISKVNRGFIEQNFLAKHREDYFAHLENEKAILGYLDENNLAFTSKNLELAFEYLKDSLIQRPQAPAQIPPEVPAEQTNPPQRPRTVTTGLEPGESSGNPPAKSKGLSWAIIDKMSDEEWEKAKRNPAIVQWMNANPRSKTSR